MSLETQPQTVLGDRSSPEQHVFVSPQSPPPTHRPGETLSVPGTFSEELYGGEPDTDIFSSLAIGDPESQRQHTGHNATDIAPAADSDSASMDQDESSWDSSETDIRELASLNLQIYRVARSIASSRSHSPSSSGHIPPPDELINITRSLFKIQGRVIERAKQTQSSSHRDQDLLPLVSNFSSSSFPHHPRHPSDASSTYLSDTPSITTSYVIHSGTVFMAFACYQHLFDMFWSVCQSICPRHEAPTDTAAGLSTRGLDGGPEGVQKAQAPDAQIVMLIELMTQLLEKLEQGQNELANLAVRDVAAAPTPLATPPMPYSLNLMDSPSFIHNTQAAPRCNGPASYYASMPGTLETGNTDHPGSQAASYVAKSMVSKQTGLREYVQKIKHSVWKIDGI